MNERGNVKPNHTRPYGAGLGTASSHFDLGTPARHHPRHAPPAVLHDDDTALPATTVALPIQGWRHDGWSAAVERVVEEVPVALVYNGLSHAVMLVSTQDLEDFAVGFSFSERIIPDRHAIFEMKIITHAGGIEVQMRIAGDRLARA